MVQRGYAPTPPPPPKPTYDPSQYNTSGLPRIMPMTNATGGNLQQLLEGADQITKNGMMFGPRGLPPTLGLGGRPTPTISSQPSPPPPLRTMTTGGGILRQN